MRDGFRLALLMVVVSVLGACATAGDEAGTTASPDQATMTTQADTTTTQAETTTSADETEETPTYGVVTAVQHPYYNRTEDAMEPTCQELGCEYMFAQPATCEAQDQVQIIRDLVTAGIDGLAIAACDAAGVEPTIEEVVESGITFVTFDADCCQSLRPIAISNSDTEMGRLHAETINSLLPDGGRIIVTVASLAAQNVRDRLEGFEQNVNPNVEVVEVYADETTPERAQEIVRTALVAYPDIDLILDQAGLVSVVAEEVKNQGYEPGEVHIIGINDFDDILALIREGYITATVMLNSGLQGELALRSLDYLRAGMTPSEDFFGTGGVVVTQENIDTYAEEDVEELNEQLRREFEALWSES